MPEMSVLYHVRRGAVFVGDSRKRGECMTERDRILERIKAVQALAERGDRGEKESAAALLERLMKIWNHRKRNSGGPPGIGMVQIQNAP